MAIRQDINKADGFFIDEDKTLAFEILGADGATPVDMTGWTLAWTVRRYVTDADPAIAKASGGSGVTITGTYNVDRATNTQRVIVAIADTDTAALAAGIYKHALKRTDEGSETILSFGDLVLQKAAA